VPRIDLLPSNDGSNGWSRILLPRQPKRPLEGDVRGDWVVVGAGFAGLAAARRLAEHRPGDTIILLEADEAGENASGRNSGFAIDLPHNVGSSLEELEGAQRYIRLSRAAIDHLERQVRVHAIDCSWSRRGRYHTAVSERGAKEVLEPISRELSALGEPWRWLDNKTLASEIGTSYHLAAVHTPGTVLMNPAALVRGLADSLPENVVLHEHTPVLEVSYENGVTLITPKGSVYAPRMVLAVNGLAEQFGFYRRRLLRFAAHASLTRPLTRSEREALGGCDDWGVTPANAFVSSTLRFTQDHRLLVRHQLIFDPDHRAALRNRDAVRARHMREFRNRFPMLPEVQFDYTWTGYVCLSRNHAPGFGRVAPNVWSAVCCNAVGVTKATISGLLVADLACGIDNPLIKDIESLGKPAKLPPRPFLDIGVHARTNFDLWSARGER
jgi:glycine/D-amino acid oxidase-like deaminating enzyme